MRLRRFVPIVALSLALLALAVSAPAEQPTNAKLPPILQGLEARSIGPANMGGRIADLAVVESDPTTFYVAAAARRRVEDHRRRRHLEARLRRPADACASAPSRSPRRTRTSSTSAPARPTRGTRVTWGDGVYRSADGGKTWKHCGLKDTQHIGRIVVHPTNPDVAYVAALGHIWGPNKERGLYKTTDGGKTWRAASSSSTRTPASSTWPWTRRNRTRSTPRRTGAARRLLRRQPAQRRSGRTAACSRPTDGGKTWEKMTGGLPDRPLRPLRPVGLPQGPERRLRGRPDRPRPTAAEQRQPASRRKAKRASNVGQRRRLPLRRQGQDVEEGQRPRAAAVLLRPDPRRSRPTTSACTCWASRSHVRPTAARRSRDRAAAHRTPTTTPCGSTRRTPST